MAEKLTATDRENIQAYLSAMKALEAKEPEYNFADEASAEAWEAWNAECLATTNKYQDSIKRALLFSLGDMTGTAPQSVAAILSALIDADQLDGQASLFPPQNAAAQKEIVDTLSRAFGVIRQGSATNALSKIRSDRAKVDEITGIATIKSGNLKVSLRDFQSIAGFKTSTHKLLDALTRKFTETGAKSPFVTLPLDEYMELRGISDKKEARKQVNADLLTMYNTDLEFTEKRRGADGGWFKMRICDAVGVVKRGNILFSFGSTYYSYLMRCTIMPYPKDAFRLDDRKNPNSYYLARRISEHKNMNAGKPNEDIISVETLLAACPYLPKYAEVKDTDRAFGRRIVEPFERDMNALSSFLSWEYCGKNGSPLPEHDLSMQDYETFAATRIHVFWTGEYPDQTKRLERKEARKRGVADSKKGGSGQQRFLQTLAAQGFSRGENP